MNHYVFGAPDSQASSDGAMGNLEATIDSALAQLDLGDDDDPDTNDFQLLVVAADSTAGPSLADEPMNNRLADLEPAVVHTPVATTIDLEPVVNDTLSALTVDSETGSTSRAKKGHSKKGKTHNSDGMVVARRSARTQGDK
jgi:hypothetical protein